MRGKSLRRTKVLQVGKVAEKTIQPTIILEGGDMVKKRKEKAEKEDECWEAIYGNDF